MVALILYLILAAILEFGGALFGAMALQQAVDVAAREIARTPGLPATGTLADVLYADAAAHPEYGNVRASLFDEGYLKIPYQDLLDAVGDRPMATYFDDKPLLNRLLFPLMVVARDGDGNPTFLEYPGIVPVAVPGPGGNRFQIPVAPPPGRRLGGPDGSVEGTTYVPVIEEVGAVPGEPATSSFNLASRVSPPSNRGLVAVRINYPFRAAGMGAALPAPADLDRDSRPGQDSHPDGSAAHEPPASVAPAEVRPFRRLISVQAIQRREVY